MLESSFNLTTLCRTHKNEGNS